VGDNLKKNKKPLKLILIGIIPKIEEKETKLAIQSLINPGGDYVISVNDKAYLLVREMGDYSNLS
jgi:hypothetical protein